MKVGQLSFQSIEIKEWSNLEQVVASPLRDQVNSHPLKSRSTKAEQLMKSWNSSMALEALTPMVFSRL